MAERGGKHTPGRGESICKGYVVRGKSGQNETLRENSTVWNTERKACASEKKLESGYRLDRDRVLNHITILSFF